VSFASCEEREFAAACKRSNAGSIRKAKENGNTMFLSNSYLLFFCY